MSPEQGIAEIYAWMAQFGLLTWLTILFLLVTGIVFIVLFFRWLTR